MLRYTLYPVAPVTAGQLTLILLDDSAVAVTPVGAAGIDTAEGVFAETDDGRALSPALL